MKIETLFLATLMLASAVANAASVTETLLTQKAWCSFDTVNFTDGTSEEGIYMDQYAADHTISSAAYSITGDMQIGEIIDGTAEAGTWSLSGKKLSLSYAGEAPDVYTVNTVKDQNGADAIQLIDSAGKVDTYQACP